MNETLQISALTAIISPALKISMVFTELASYVVKLLQNNRDMIDDYFSLEIDNEGNICTIPMLLEGYVPYLGNVLTDLNVHENITVGI